MRKSWPSHRVPEFVPILVSYLRQDRRDAVLDRLLEGAEATPREMTARFDSLAGPLVTRRYGRQASDLARRAPAVPFKEFLLETLRSNAKLIAAEKQRRRGLVRSEFRRIRDLPMSAALQVAPTSTAVLEALRRYHLIYNQDCCEDKATEGAAADGAPARKFAHRVSRLKCRSQEDFTGADHVYFISIAGDGHGNVYSKRSLMFRIEEDQTISPSFYTYDMRDPGGFLDVALRLYEEDGGYAAAGRAVNAIGSAISSLGFQQGSAYVGIAGAGIAIGGMLIELFGELDEDDDLGTHDWTYENQNDLDIRIGATDARVFDGDDADYQAKIKLLSAP
jgi:hypothetical protein